MRCKDNKQKSMECIFMRKNGKGTRKTNKQKVEMHKK